ncbi:MAG: hypothetical protein F6K47_28930, partial [Symploca sp. SIO2E6]|nr:hypothetical protein [Symploca sp. SIO2E6]
MQKVNLKFVFVVIFLTVFALVKLAYPNQFNWVLRDSLENGWFSKLLICYVIITIIGHSLVFPDPVLLKVTGYRMIVKPLDVLLNIGTYVAVSSTALNLLKATFIQKFFGDVIYFNNFEDLDIYTMMGVSVLLSFYVIINMT